MIQTSFNGLKYELNKENLTATVIGAENILFHIEIPRSILYQSQEYLINTIGKISFAYHKNIRSIRFTPDSELQLIDDEAFTHSRIQSISIPSSVTKIGKKAFNSCEELVDIKISPESQLSIIGEECFFFCGIKSFYLPRLVTKIPKNSFDSCSELKTFTIPEDSELQTIEKEAFAWTPIEYLYFPSKLNQFGEECFCSTTNLNTVEISPKNKNLSYLDDDQTVVLGKSDPKESSFDVLVFVSRIFQSFIIPKSIRYIGTSSFSGNENLEYVFFENGSNVISINEGAFAHSTLLGIKIPSSVVHIKNCAFARCESLKIVDFESDSKLKFIGYHAFSFTDIVKFTFPSNIQELKKEWCFCLSFLTEIILSPQNNSFIYLNSQIVIGKSDPKSDEFDSIVFARRDITQAKIPSFIKYINSCAFNDCVELENVQFSKDSLLEKIDSYAFGNTSIKTIFIPKHVKIIHKNAFDRCNLLKSVEFHQESELIKIGKFAFNSDSLNTIVIPRNVEIIKAGFTSCYEHVRHVSVSPNNKKLKFVNEDLLIGKKDSKSDSFDALIGSNDDFEKILIPSFVKYLNYFAFVSHEKLKIVNFEENSNLFSIGGGAFELTSIKSITFPDSLRIVERCAFKSCHYLLALEFLSDEITIDSKCFSGSYNFSIISFPKANKIKICFDAFENQSCCLFALQSAELILFPAEND